ncbi:MAG: penicillin-binding protein activator LpoB, partial [Sphaerochaetaceae bacterium]
MKHRSLTIVLLIAIILAFSSCTTVRVSRLNENKKIDLSGDWNDTDISLVSERLIRSCLKGSWFSAFTKAKKADPVVIVGRFSNMSSERIDTSIIT